MKPSPSLFPSYSALRLAVAAIGVALLALPAPAPAGAAEPSGPSAAPAGKAKTPSHVVNLNTADEKELESLPRVGPALAARIVEYRKTVGSFKTVEELVNVKGVGEKMLETLRPLLTVGSSGTKGSGTSGGGAKP